MEWYPPVSFYFEVKFSGFSNKNDTKFLEVTGLEKKLEYEELGEGGRQLSLNVPARVKYTNITLKRGLLTGSELTQWCDNAFDNYEIDLKDIQISLLDEKGNPLASWSIVNAYPVKWSVSKFNSISNEVAIESLEIAYESFKRTI